MKRIILLLILLSWFTGQAFADATQDRRLAISVSIFPRIVAVDQGLNDKLDSEGNVRLAIVYRSNKKLAQNIADQMTRKVSNIGGKKIIVETVAYADLIQDIEKIISGAFLVETLNRIEIMTINAYLTGLGVLFFSPFEGDVEAGAMASIFIGAKIRPYFNTTSVRRAKINLKPAIMGVSKLHE